MATSNLTLQNWFETTLSSAINSTDTTISLNSVPTGTEGYLVIEPDNTSTREIIYFNSKTVSAVVCPSAVLGRGVDGTTATSHAAGSTVRMTITAGYFTALQDGSGLNIQAVAGQPFGTGWVTNALPAVSSVTNNGNRSYDITFASTVASLLSPGMRIRTTRTVTAPTQCTSLNGTTQYYSRASGSLAGITFTNNFTCAAWIKPSAYQSSTIISRFSTTGFLMFLGADGRLNIQAKDAGTADVATSYQSVSLNKWTHVAATMDVSSNTVTMYFDGVLVPSAYTAGTSTSVTQAGNLEVGSYNGGTSPFAGKIAQASIHNAILNATQIKAMMAQTIDSSSPSIVAGYTFNNAVTDVTANANTLTANGSAVATNADSPFANATGTPSGTTDVALVQAVSTTTATVQVPEGCTIPTSGGVSATAYSTTANPFGWVADKGRWEVASLLRTDSATTSNATYGAFLSGGYTLTVPVGNWTVGHMGCFLNSTTTSVYFNISKTALTGLAEGAGNNTSPYAVVVRASAAALTTWMAAVSNQESLSSASTFVMYTLGATTSGTIFGSGAKAAIYAIPAGI